MKHSSLSLILKIVIGAVFVVCAVIVFFQYYKDNSGTYAYIYQDGTLLYQVDLTEKKEPYEFTVECNFSGESGYNTIKVENGTIGICDTNCPDKTCERMGMTSSTNFPITCLPHKLIIQISEKTPSMENETQDIDVISR